MQSRKDTILKMLETEPNDEFLNYALAIEQEKEGELSVAIETLFLLKKNSPTYLGLYLKLAELLSNSNKETTAIEIINDGILLAKSQKNTKTEGELKVLLMELED